MSKASKVKILKTARIVYTDWKSGRAYRVNEGEKIRCVGYGCGRILRIGEFYTRHKPVIAPYAYSVHALCRDCLPFWRTEQDDSELLEEYKQTEAFQEDEVRKHQNYG